VCGIILCQQISQKWFGNVNMMSYYDVTNSAQAVEMNAFKFFKSKSNPTVSFQNPIQMQLSESFKISIPFKSKILIVFC